jgi:hypothetical protein
MKTPLKPFTVEVKRSRSSSSTAKPDVSEPPVFVGAKPEPAPASPSHARQLAEQMFRSLTVSSSNGLDTKMSAESVFQPRPKSVAVPEIVKSDLAADHLQAQVVPAHETEPPKPREPRARKMRVATAPAKKARKPKAPDAVAVEPLAIIASSQRQQDLPVGIPETPAPAPVAQVTPQSLAGEPEHQRSRQNKEWGPGERWKKRLRHLR